MRATWLVVLSVVGLSLIAGESHAGGLRLFQRNRCEPVCMPAAEPCLLAGSPELVGQLPPAPPGMKWKTVTEQITVPVQVPRRLPNGQIVMSTEMQTRQVTRQVLVSDDESASLVQIAINALSKRIDTVVEDGATVKTDLTEIKRQLEVILRSLPKKE